MKEEKAIDTSLARTEKAEKLLKGVAVLTCTSRGRKEDSLAVSPSAY